MNVDEPSCGKELAEDADVPEMLSELWEHVATNLETHARWVGTDSEAARYEHDSLRRIASEYRTIAMAAERAAAIMKSMDTAAPADHDPSRFDREGQARWMRKKIDLQRQFAETLLRHADVSELEWSRLAVGPLD